MSAATAGAVAAPGDTLVVAGLWVRPMAQSARRAGWNVVGLDVFGDRDTRQACVEWRRIGDAATMTIARAALREALDAVVSGPGVIGCLVGCVLGSGFEGRPELVDDVQAKLRVIGMDAARMAALRDPVRWFDALDRFGLEHPPVAFAERVAPGLDGPWLVKDMRGSGGWHIREAHPGATLAPGEYLQRRVEGRSMSALFLADGQHARIVGISAQDVRRHEPPRSLRSLPPEGVSGFGRPGATDAPLPFVYHGAIGPIRDDAIKAELLRGLDALVPAFGLIGLASADVLATAHGLLWLEINPRPSASMLLYDDAWPQGLMHAHVEASAGRLPGAVPRIDGMVGHRVVFTRHAITVDATMAAEWAQHPWCHDLPMPGTVVGAGEPLCSVSARTLGTGKGADDEVALLDALARNADDALLFALTKP